MSIARRIIHAVISLGLVVVLPCIACAESDAPGFDKAVKPKVIKVDAVPQEPSLKLLKEVKNPEKTFTHWTHECSWAENTYFDIGCNGNSVQAPEPTYKALIITTLCSPQTIAVLTYNAAKSKMMSSEETEQLWNQNVKTLWSDNLVFTGYIQYPVSKYSEFKNIEWRFFLITDDGQRIEPVSVNTFPSNTSVIPGQRSFGYWAGRTRVPGFWVDSYYCVPLSIVFPKNDGQGHGLLAPDTKSLTLALTSSVKQAKLVWQFQH